MLAISVLRLINLGPSSTQGLSTTLKDSLANLPGYTASHHVTLSEDHTDMLNLDDYLFADYLGPQGLINLYIGYYFSANKAYAAHSPLVCYPSQGWKIESTPEKKQIRIGNYKINYSQIITKLEDKKELVLYWYQAGKKTNRTVYANKISMGYNRLTTGLSHHAFVRIAIPIPTSSTPAIAEGAVEYFLHSFYPQFITSIFEESR